MFTRLKVWWLLRGLRSRNEHVARDAMQKLAAMREPSAVIPLMRFVNRDDLGSDAISALLTLGDPRAVEPMIEALGNESLGMFPRNAAAWALVKMAPDRALAPLVGALKAEDPLVRAEVAANLGELGDPQAIRPLVKVLDDTDAYVRECAAGALGRFNEPQAVEGLISALADGETNVRIAAANALEKPGDARWQSLIQGDGDDFQRVAETRDPRAVKGLVAALKYLKPFARAAEALGNLREQSAVPALIRALDYESNDYRERAARMLGKIGDPAAVDPLLDRLKVEERPRVRAAIAEALGKLGDTRAIEPLSRALYDDDNDVKRASAAALGKLRAVDALLAVISPGNQGPGRYVGSYAAAALGEIGDPRAVDALIVAIYNDQWCAEAAIALGKLRDRRAFEHLCRVQLNKDQRNRAAALEALGMLGDARAFDHLKSALLTVRFDFSQIERRAAASALAALRDPRAVEPLVQVLAERNYYLRHDVAWALKELLTGPDRLTVDRARWKRIYELVCEPLPRATSDDQCDNVLEAVGVAFPSEPPDERGPNPA